MRNTPPPPDSSWPSGPQGSGGAEEERPQQDQVWAWPPAAQPHGGQGTPVWAWPPPPTPRPAWSGPARPRPGSAYHRLARTWRFRWWIPLLAVVAVVAVGFLAQTVVVLAALIVAAINGYVSTDNGPFGEPVPDLVVQLIALASMAPIVFLAARLIQRRPAGTLASVESRIRWRWLLACAAVAIPVMGVFLAALALLQALVASDEAVVGSASGGQDFLLAVVVILLLVPFQASAEEFALRGFLMQAVGAYGRAAEERNGDSAVSRFLRTPVLGIVISTALFTSLHAYTGWGLANVALLGAGLAVVTWLTGGLEAAIGLHVVHNIVVFIISAYEGTLTEAGTGEGSWVAVAGTFVELLLYLAVVLWLARRMGIRRVVPGDPGSDQEPPASEPSGPATWPAPPYPAPPYGSAAPRYGSPHDGASPHGSYGPSWSGGGDPQQGAHG